jgi:hypothetical protein
LSVRFGASATAAGTVGKQGVAALFAIMTDELLVGVYNIQLYNSRLAFTQ